MPSISIVFQYTVDSEIQRVKETLNNLEWFTKNNYRFPLPASIRHSADIQMEIIRKAVENEYDLCIYQIAQSAILKSWCGNNGFVRTINQKMIGTYLLSEMTIILTRYGTQGSYKVPNSVVVNISNVPNEYIIKTVIHESFHLMTECLIKKYSVEHWVKERIVDLIIDFEYKSRFKMQSVPDWVLATDVIFRKYYPNIVLITRKASKIKATAHSTENMQGPSGQID